MRSARSYPEFSKDLFKRVIADEDHRRTLYPDLIAYAPIMSLVDPELLAQLAETELLEELPADEIERERMEREEHYKRLAEIREIPEEKRTERQSAALNSMFFPIGSDRYDLDDVGIGRHNNYYFPASAMHEPFKSLFANKPDVALRLVRNLANHATKGWRQIHSINRQRMGTPIPASKTRCVRLQSTLTEDRWAIPLTESTRWCGPLTELMIEGEGGRRLLIG